MCQAMIFKKHLDIAWLFEKSYSTSVIVHHYKAKKAAESYIKGLYKIAQFRWRIALAASSSSLISPSGKSHVWLCCSRVCIHGEHLEGKKKTIT